MPTSRRLMGAALVAALAAVVVTGGARAQPSDPGSCKPGFVWREAVSEDRVCVPPRVRAETADDNRRTEARRETRGGVPPGSCRRGYVWREAVPGDHVCVTPSVRAATARDNRLALTRVAAGAQPPAPGAARAAMPERRVDTACDTYARRARKQFELAGGMAGCAVRPGPRWQDDYPAHYRWCMAAAPRARQAEEQARDRWLEKCGAVVKID